MDIRTKEAIRYLGFGKHPVDEQTLQMIQECFCELENVAEKKAIYEVYELCIHDDHIQIEQLQSDMVIVKDVIQEYFQNQQKIS